MGEVTKWVSVSEARFGMITSVDNKKEIEVELYGVAGEEVSLGFVDQFGEMFTVDCVFSAESSSNEEYLTMTVSSTGTCSH
jgi:hypothetical protein